MHKPAVGRVEKMRAIGPEGRAGRHCWAVCVFELATRTRENWEGRRKVPGKD